MRAKYEGSLEKPYGSILLWLFKATERGIGAIDIPRPSRHLTKEFPSVKIQSEQLA